MIARIWHGRTRAEVADEYVEYVSATGIEAHRNTEGNLGSLILRQDEGEYSSFVVLSFWESMDAVLRFAGADPERAVYFPEDERYLLELEPGVDHYEVPVARWADASESSFLHWVRPRLDIGK